MDGFDGFEEHLALTRNGNLFYLRKEGTGHPIIFLHGLGASVKTWRNFLPFIPDGLDVYLVDLLGHGKSDSPNINYDVTVQTDCLKDFISGLEIWNPMLFGHSYGAWVATRYAISNQVSGLIIEDSAGLDPQIQEIISSGNAENYKRNLIEGSIKIGANELVISSIVMNFARELVTKEVLSVVDAEALLIWGTNDQMVDPKFGKWENESMHDSKLVMIEGGGHVPHLLMPMETGNAMSDFMGLTPF